MKILVLIKQVPGTTNARMNPDTGIMVRDASDAVINPLDEHALAEAVKIKEALPGTVITALTMGPASAQKALREACARGADKGILLSHRAFGGSDTIATARVLAAAILKTGAFDLILAGEKAVDGETGQTGPMTAAMLNIPAITFARQVKVKDNYINVIRLTEDGEENVEVSLPALVTVVKDINTPPLPSLRRQIIAKKLTFPLWGPKEAGVAEIDVGMKGSPTRVVKVFSPTFARKTTFHRVDSEDAMAAAALRVLNVLSESNLLEKGNEDGR